MIDCKARLPMFLYEISYWNHWSSFAKYSPVLPDTRRNLFYWNILSWKTHFYWLHTVGCRISLLATGWIPLLSSESLWPAKGVTTLYSLYTTFKTSRWKIWFPFVKSEYSRYYFSTPPLHTLHQPLRPNWWTQYASVS